MAGAQEVRAGGAFVEIYVKNAAFTKGLLAAQQHLQSFGSKAMSLGTSIMGVGAAVVAPLAAAVNQFVSLGSQLDDVSKRTGVAVSSLAELKYAAEQSGATFEDVEKAIKTMQKNGFSADQFDAIADSIAALDDPAERTRRAMEVFGKAGTAILPMFEELAELRSQANKMGLVPTEESVAAAAKLGDTFDQIKSSVVASIYEIGSALVPILQPAAELIREIAISTGKWVKENSQLFRTIALVGAGLVAAGAATVALGASAWIAGAAFGAIAVAIGAVGTAVGFLLTPVGALTALVAGGVTYWALYSKSGQDAMRSIGSVFSEVGKTLKDTWGGVVDALSAGDLKLAAEVAWAGVKLVWEQGTQDINRYWQDAKAFFLSVWTQAQDGMAKIFIDIWAGMQSGWAEAVAAMQQVWNTLTSFIASSLTVVWQQAHNRFADLLVLTGKLTEEEAIAYKASKEKEAIAAVSGQVIDHKAEAKRIEAERRKKRQDVEAMRSGANQIIDENTMRRQQEIEDARQKAIADKQKAVDDARLALENARARASGAASAARDEALGQAMARSPLLDGALQSAKAFGTFSASALLAGGLAPQDKVVKAIEKSDKERKKETAGMIDAFKNANPKWR